MKGQPFFFDQNIFDAEKDGIDDTHEDKEPEPEFTREQLEIAQNAAFEKGRKAGLDDSQNSIEQALLTVINSIDKNINTLFSAEEQRNKKYQDESVHLTLNIIRKIVPFFVENYGLEEFENTLRAMIQDHITEDHITLTIHPEIEEALRERIQKLQDDNRKKITLTASTSLGKYECNVSWPDGGMTYNQEKIAQKTLTLMKEALAERGISVHDSADNSLADDAAQDSISPSPSEPSDDNMVVSEHDKTGEP